MLKLDDPFRDEDILNNLTFLTIQILVLRVNFYFLQFWLLAP